MTSSTVVAIFTPEELEIHAGVFADLTRRATSVTPRDQRIAARMPPTWEGLVTLATSSPRLATEAYKLTALHNAGWHVAEFSRIASGFTADDERYCARCEGVLDVAFGLELRAWRKCATCGPTDAPSPW